MKHLIAFFIFLVFLLTGATLLLTPAFQAYQHLAVCTLSVPVLVSGVILLVFAAMIAIPTDTRTALDYGISLFKQVKP